MHHMFSSTVLLNNSISFLCLPASPLTPNRGNIALVRAEVNIFLAELDIFWPLESHF